MNPAAVLDFIERRGETATITSADTPGNTATIKAHVRWMRGQEDTGPFEQVYREVKIAGSAINFVPQRNDRVTVGGQTFTVDSVFPAKIGDDVAVYSLYVRG